MNSISTQPSTDLSSALQAAAADLMAIEGVTVGEVEPRLLPVRRNGKLVPPKPRPAERLPLPSDAVRLRGRLLVPADEAYRRLADRLQPLGLTPVLRKGDVDREVVVTALRGTIAEIRPNVRLALTLFILTALSCFFVGGHGLEVLGEPGQAAFSVADGLAYAGPLLFILLAHEFGHYLTARRLGAPVTLPYFVPLPISQLGTMGAVINMPAPPRNRRHLLAIGAAGPLAGLLVAIPVLWIGLGLSQVQPLPPGNYFIEGNSLLYALLKFARFGRFLPGGGYDVFIHPMAFAGWVGLLVTGLNLIPAGQLDGGHIVYALLGARWADRIGWAVMLALAALSFLWTGWLIWVALIFFVTRVRMPMLDDITGLTNRQRVLAVVMVLVFLLVFSPVPFTVVYPQ